MWIFQTNTTATSGLIFLRRCVREFIDACTTPSLIAVLTTIGITLAIGLAIIGLTQQGLGRLIVVYPGIFRAGYPDFYLLARLHILNTTPPGNSRNLFYIGGSGGRQMLSSERGLERALRTLTARPTLQGVVVHDLTSYSQTFFTSLALADHAVHLKNDIVLISANLFRMTFPVTKEYASQAAIVDGTLLDASAKSRTGIYFIDHNAEIRLYLLEVMQRMSDNLIEKRAKDEELPTDRPHDLNMFLSEFENDQILSMKKNLARYQELSENQYVLLNLMVDLLHSRGVKSILLIDTPYQRRCSSAVLYDKIHVTAMRSFAERRGIDYLDLSHAIPDGMDFIDCTHLQTASARDAVTARLAIRTHEMLTELERDFQ